MILVTGAAGTVGGAVLRALLDQKADVRALVRPGKTLDGFAGVPAVQGDLADANSMRRALDGIDALFLMSPGSLDLEAPSIDGAAALELSRVVLLSALNADEASPSALLSEHGRSEGHLIESGVPYVILRPNGFMQNFVNQNAPLVASQSILPSPAGEAKISFVDVRDIAAVAAVALTTPAFEGETIEITGPVALSYHDIAASLSRVTGRTVSYIDLPEDAAKKAFVENGMSGEYADALLALYRTYRAGDAEFVVRSVQDITGKPARSFEQFATENAKAFSPA